MQLKAMAHPGCLIYCTDSPNATRALSQYPKRRLFVRSRKVFGTLNCCIALKFGSHIGSNAAEVPVKFQSDRTILNTNLAASRSYDKTSFRILRRGPG